jgi:hypothetical protein
MVYTGDNVGDLLAVGASASLSGLVIGGGPFGRVVSKEVQNLAAGCKELLATEGDTPAFGQVTPQRSPDLGRISRPTWGSSKCPGSIDSLRKRVETVQIGLVQTTRAELQEEVNNPHSQRTGSITVAEFAGATIHENGRITMTWPDGERCQKETGRRESTIRRLRDGLRPFVREFHDRPLDSFTRDEAVTWTRPKGANIQQAVRQFFNHAEDRDLIPRNLFTKLGASKRKRRVDRPDFEIISDEQYARLRQGARKCRADDYGLVLEGAVLTIGDEALRPGEIFALHRPELHFERT